MNALIEAYLNSRHAKLGMIAVEYETQIKIIFNFQSIDTCMLDIYL